jgi:hypothetical protein
MTAIKNFLIRIYSWFELYVISPIRWTYLAGMFRSGKYWNLTADDYNYLRAACKANYYLIVTYRKTHLTSYLQQIASLIKNGKLTKWTHAFMNMDDGQAVQDVQYIFLESTALGVHYSTFSEVFDCDSVALIVPKGMTPAEWTEVIDNGILQLGKAYDTLFDYHQENTLSCVELVRAALQVLPDYNTRFANFEAMIVAEGEVTPQMLAECQDFEIAWQVRR